MFSRSQLHLNLTRTITAGHLILRLRLSKLPASLIAKFSHNRIFRTKPLRIMRCPSNMRLIENIRPFRVVLLLLALGRHLVHEVLADKLAAASKVLARHNWSTQVALNVLNLNCLSNPLPLLQSVQRPESTRAVVCETSVSMLSPCDGEISEAWTMALRLTVKLRIDVARIEEAIDAARHWMRDCKR